MRGRVLGRSGSREESARNLDMEGRQESQGLFTPPKWDTVVWAKECRRGERRKRRKVERREKRKGWGL